MIVVKPATTTQEITTIVQHMQGYGTPEDTDFLGFWDDAQCIGGASISSSGKNLFAYALEAATPICLGVVLYDVFKILLPKYPELTGKIQKSNIKSIIIANKVGFRKVYESETEIYYVFNKSMWKYQQRWPL